MNARPERGVGRVFANHGVVADELQRQRIVVNQQFGGNGELRLRILAGRAAHRSRRGLNGGKERSIQNHLDVTELRQQAG